MVVEAEGKFWLFSFGPKDAAPKQGEPVASVGPLQMTSDALPAAESYEVVAYLAVMPAGTHTRVHTHPGPEADQRTGRLTRGVVKEILTKSSYHPHGIKVRLETGEVGRVKEIVGEDLSS